MTDEPDKKKRGSRAIDVLRAGGQKAPSGDVLPVTGQHGSAVADQAGSSGSGAGQRVVDAEKRKGTALGMRKFSADLPPDLYRWLKRRAAEEDVPAAVIVQALVEEYRDGRVTPDLQGAQARRLRR